MHVVACNDDNETCQCSVMPGCVMLRRESIVLFVPLLLYVLWRSWCVSAILKCHEPEYASGSLYGLIVGSALENSESVSELVNMISSCRVFNGYVDSLHTRQFSMKLL